MSMTIEEFLIDSFEIILAIATLALIHLYIYDRYVQRKHALLVNYPVIGRMRYFFEALREPLRQYFADETFYESRDKIEWVYKAAKNKPNYKSFSVSQPFAGSRFIIKHSSHVLNKDEVSKDYTVTFGEKREKPFKANSPVIRSAMSDGALSPEAVRAFSLGAQRSGYSVNTGEGGLTSNHLYTLRADSNSAKYLEIVKGTPFAEMVYKVTKRIFNGAIAAKFYRRIVLNKKTENTYIYDPDSHVLFRVNWDAPLETFPQDVPKTMPNTIFQMSSGLYGVRDSRGEFNEDRYQKVMRFCRMTEIKIAQGAKQTGGKLAAEKVSADIAYYRGVEEGKDLFSPNRFPYAKTDEELLDFIERLQQLSGKPVGIKIVISDTHNIEDLAIAMHKRKAEGKSIPDFITVDSGEGGSATAPLELMESVGLTTPNALYVVTTILKKYQLRDDIKVIASGKILTPDDLVTMLAMGADAVGIARGFMMAGGCIRARMCSGYGSHKCPIGMATQDPKKRASYLVIKEAGEMANYHRNLLSGMKVILEVMGLDHYTKLSLEHLTFKTSDGKIHFDVEKYFHEKLGI